jgi:hypothetical protein
MKRGFFFITVLLLSLLLLPILPITAPKPNPQVSVNVELIGRDITSSSMTFAVDVQRGEKTVIVHPADQQHVDLMFMETTQGLWYVNSELDFADDQEGKLAFRIDPNSNNANVVFNFGRYTEQDVEDGIIIDRYVGWLKYQLLGNGQWIDQNFPYGSVSVANEEFNICQIYYTPSGKGKGNSATGGSFEEVWSETLSFEIVITPLP